MGQVKDLPEGHCHRYTLTHFGTYPPSYTLLTLFLRPPPPRCEVDVRANSRWGSSIGGAELICCSGMAWLLLQNIAFCFHWFLPFCRLDGTSHCVRAEAQSELVLAIKTNIHLSAAPLSHSRMRSRTRHSIWQKGDYVCRCPYLRVFYEHVQPWRAAATLYKDPARPHLYSLLTSGPAFQGQTALYIQYSALNT